MSNMKGRPSAIARAIRWLATLAGAGLASAAPVSAQTVTPSAAPAEWVRYAEGATATITEWLQAEDETATRLRGYLDRTRPSADQATAPLQIKIWVDAEGAVSRIDFPPFAHEEANADLRAVIVGRRLAGPPPQGMLLPMRIAVQLDPAPADRSGPAPAVRDGAFTT